MFDLFSRRSTATCAFEITIVGCLPTHNVKMGPAGRQHLTRTARESTILISPFLHLQPWFLLGNLMPIADERQWWWSRRQPAIPNLIPYEDGS
jgi:hypothetical protein